jgi:predicted double-glycine peptidase
MRMLGVFVCYFIISILNSVVFAQGVKIPCGAASLKVAALLNGVDVPFEKIRSLVIKPGETDLATMADIKSAALSFGLDAVGVEMNRAELQTLKHIGIAHLQLKANVTHFVVVAEVRDENVMVIDTNKVSWISIANFEQYWTGRMLLVSNSKIEVAGRISNSSKPQSEMTAQPRGLIPLNNPASLIEQPDQSLSCEFSLKNTSDQPITILDIQPCCGSTAKLLTSNSVSPGDIAKIELKVTGSQNAQREVLVKLQNLPAILLKAATNVTSTSTQFDPPMLDFGDVITGSDTKVAEVSFLTDGSSAVVDAVSSLAGLSLTVHKDISSPRRFVVRGHIDLHAFHQGRFIDSMSVSIKDEKSHKISQLIIPIMGNLTRPIRVSSDRLFFNNAPTGKPIEAAFTLEGVDGRPFKISSVTSTVKNVEFIASSSQEPQLIHHISVRWIPTMAETMAGTVQVKTDHPVLPNIKIPIYGSVKEK